MHEGLGFIKIDNIGAIEQIKNVFDMSDVKEETKPQYYTACPFRRGLEI
jgi:hypothetical protein